MIKKISYYNILFLALVILSCTSDRISERGERASLSDKKMKDIHIGVVDTSGYANLFLQGVKLALKELNDNNDILERTIIPVFYDDKMSPDKGLEISEKLAKNRDIVAVIGHRFSDVAIPASVTYERNGIVFISTGATDPALTEYSDNFTFRNNPSDKEIGKKLAELAKNKKFEKVLIMYDRESEGKRLAEIFEDEAIKRKIKITASKSYYPMQKDIALVISDIKQKYEFDAVFLGGFLPFAASIIKEFRILGIKVPIMGGTALYSPELPNIAGKYADGTIVATVYDPILSGSVAEKFNKRFIKEYGVEADTHAALGYDAVMVLVHAINKSRSTAPVNISTALHSIEYWKGATGNYSFTRSGDITGKTVFFKQMRNGDFNIMTDVFEQPITDPYELVESITLRLPLKGTLSIIDPGLAENSLSFEVCKQLFSGLTDINPENGHVIPGLAEKWTSEEYCTKWQFHMRKDAVWTDGKPVTAHDIVWAVQRNATPATKSPYVQLLNIIKNVKNLPDNNNSESSKIGVSAVDDHIVEFNLEYPASWFPALTALPVFNPLPRHIIELYKEHWTEPGNIQTSGPYKIAMWDKNDLMVLKKNPRYYDTENVSIDQIRYYMIQKSSAGLEMYKNNELDIIGGSYLPLPNSDILRIKTTPAFADEYSDNPDLCTYAIAFNTSKPPADSILVRKAVSAAIDRKLVLNAVSADYGIPANSFIPNAAFGNERAEITNLFDPANSEKWLEEAGVFQGENVPAIVLRHGGEGFYIEISNVVKKILEHYTKLKIILLKEDNNFKDTPDYHMLFFKLCGEYLDPANWIYHPLISSHITQLNDRNFSGILEDARVETNAEKRKELYRKAEKIIVENAVVVPLFFGSAPCLVKPRVKKWYNTPSGGQHIRNWYLEE